MNTKREKHKLLSREEFIKIDAVLRQKNIGSIQCVVGFDGFVDSIYRPVKLRTDEGLAIFYDTIEAFGERVLQSAGRSSDTEIVLNETRAGGNGPLLSLSLAACGFRVMCAGPLGEPEIMPVFDQLKNYCHCISLGNPAQTLAFEFNDGKLMFGCQSGLDSMDWQRIKSAIGLEQLSRLVRDSSLLALVNWSYIWQMDEILNGIIREVFPRIEGHAAEKLLFFDLSDISNRSEPGILKIMQSIGLASKTCQTVLSLNENEAWTLAKILACTTDNRLAELAATIRLKTGVHKLIIHSHKEAAAATSSETSAIENIFIDKPLLSTGGGDNFNGGLCLGLLLDLPIKYCLMLGSAAASYYVSTGVSAGLSELLQFISRYC